MYKWVIFSLWRYNENPEIYDLLVCLIVWKWLRLPTSILYDIINVFRRKVVRNKEEGRKESEEKRHNHRANGDIITVNYKMMKVNVRVWASLLWGTVRLREWGCRGAFIGSSSSLRGTCGSLLLAARNCQGFHMGGWSQTCSKYRVLQ